MNTEYPSAKMTLVHEAAAALKATGRYEAAAETCYKGKSAQSIALAICCDLNDLGIECHVEGNVITLDA